MSQPHDTQPPTDHTPGTVAFAPRTESVPAHVVVPGYEIEGVLGRGGMGVVYKARHLALKRTVALKMILAGGHAGERELARFRIEAEAVARVQHPNIVQIHEIGEADGVPFCALEFVAGGTLAAKLNGKAMPAREATRLVETLARAIHLAHSRNVVHRDLKPANVLLTADGTPKITDFGLARRTDSDSGATQVGMVLGTPSYMAPEQASGLANEAGPAADVYALGAILYVCLTGRPPFKGATAPETLEQVRTLEPVAPRLLNPALALDLETICLKCLRKEPEARYASAAELADELARYQRGEPILARPLGRVERGWRWCRRNPLVAALTATVLLVLTAGITATSILAWVATTAREQAELEAANARGSERAARASHDEVLRTTDRLVTSVADGLVRPLATQVPARNPTLPPLNDSEVAALLELATSEEDRLGLRFVQVALVEPGATRQFKDRATFALHAALRLDRTRRSAAEALLGERLNAAGVSPEQRVHVALCLAELGPSAPLASQAAAVLTQALAQTANHFELQALARGLQALAPHLPADEVAGVYGRAVGVLIRALDQQAARNILGPLGSAMAPLVAHLDHKEAATAAAALTQTLDRTADPTARWYLANALARVASRLGPDESARLRGKVVLLLIQSLGRLSDLASVSSLADDLLMHVSRLDRREIPAVVAALTGELSSATHYLALRRMGEALVTLAARLEPKEAADAARFLTLALQPAKADGMAHLAQGLRAVVARLEPAAARTVLLDAATRATERGPLNGLAHGITDTAARLEPQEAAALLTQAREKLTEVNAARTLASGLAEVAARLEPKEADALLTQTLSKTTDAFSLSSLTKALVEVSARLEPKETATTLTRALQRVNQLGKGLERLSLAHLAGGLRATAPRLAAQDAAEVVAVLRPMVGKTPSRDILMTLAALAERLAPKEAAPLYGEVVAQLILAIGQTQEPTLLQNLGQDLTAVAPQMDPQAAADAVAALTQALGQVTHAESRAALATGLAAVSVHLNPADASRVCAQVAGTFLDALCATPVAPNQSALTRGLALTALTRGLTTLAHRLEATDAAAVAATFAQASEQPRHPLIRAALARGVTALAARLDPKDAAPLANRAVAALTLALRRPVAPMDASALTQSLAVALASVPPREAVGILTQALTQATDASVQSGLARSLMTLAPRLAPGEVVEPAAALLQGMSQGADPTAVRNLTEAFAALADRMEPADAARACRQAAATLLRDVGTNANPFALHSITLGLSRVAVHLDPQDARAALATLTEASGKTTEPRTLHYLARSLSAVAAQLGAEDASPAQSRAAALLLLALSKTTDTSTYASLAKDLQAVAVRLAPEDAAEVAAGLFLCLSKADFTTGKHLLDGLPALLTRAGEPLPPQVLVDLLKQPFCVGKARTLVLEQLTHHYQRPFANPWEFVDYASEQKLGLDLTTPPRRPRLVAPTSRPVPVEQ